MKSVLIAVAACVAFCSISLPAAADPNKKDDNYGYIFSDDPLKADTMGSMGAQIKIVPLGRRDRLLRPRVHFVTEMLKSVETM